MEFHPIQCDGHVADRLAVFIYGSPTKLEQLYKDDPLGFNDSILKTCQILGSSHKIGLVSLDSKPESTSKLHEYLLKNDRCEIVAERHLPVSSREAALEWLDAHWEEIAAEITRNKDLQRALVGLLRWEFKQTWVPDVKDPNWVKTRPKRYLPDNELRKVPVMNTFVSSVKDLFKKHRLEYEPKDIECWIAQVINSHYHLFGMRFLETRNDYSPSLTRSFIFPGKPMDEVSELVTPFIAGKILLKKEVNNRRDLIKYAVDWIGTKEGESILRDITDYRNGLALVDPTDKQRALDEAKQALKSKTNRPLSIFLNLLGLGVKTYKLEPSMSDQASQLASQAAMCKKFLWLWKLRNSSLATELAKKVRELANTD